MNKRVETVVNGFRRLSDEEQAEAWMAIEAICQSLRENEPHEARPRPEILYGTVQKNE